MKMKFLILLFLSLSFVVSAQNSGYRLRSISESIDKKSYFGNPQEKMRLMKTIYLRAAKEILENKKRIDNLVGMIIRNERIFSGYTNQKEIKKLVDENKVYFKSIEALRLKIAIIQKDAAKQVYDLEKKSYDFIFQDVKNSLLQIAGKTSEYWLAKRKLMFTASELKNMLNHKKLKALYK